MANNEDVNQAQGAPAADIPDLKKKEKERKKAGAAWSGAKPGGGSFSGATGGTVARAAASAAGSTGGAVAQAAGAGWLSSTVATLTATVLGKAILAAGVAAFMAGAGMFGYALLRGGTGATGETGDLGALSSSMKVRTNGADRTGYVASNGEIMFDPLKKAEAKKEPEKAPEDKTAGDAVPPTEVADAAAGKPEMNRPGLEHNLSGAKLSSSLGGGFGGKNIFSGNSGAPKLNDGLAKMNIKGAQKGTLSSGARKAQTGRMVSGSKSKGAKSNKAFGQLRVAKGMSMLGAGTSGAEGARATAANAFDGSNDSGNIEGSAGPQTGAVDSPSSPNGAPDMTAPNVATPDGVFAGPDIAQALAGISDLAKAAGEMKKNGMMLIAMGVVLVALGIYIMNAAGWAFGIGLVIGAIIVGIGLMLGVMGKMMMDQSEQMKAMAEQMGDALAARTGDVKQNEINKYCIDRAYEGTDPANCNPPDSVTENSRINEQDKAALNTHGENAKEKDTIKEIDPTEGLNGKPTGQ